MGVRAIDFQSIASCFRRGMQVRRRAVRLCKSTICHAPRFYAVVFRELSPENRCDFKNPTQNGQGMHAFESKMRCRLQIFSLLNGLGQGKHPDDTGSLRDIGIGEPGIGRRLRDPAACTHGDILASIDFKRNWRSGNVSVQACLP